MIRSLNIGDTVFTPCTKFNSGKTCLEEQRVKDVGPDFIVLTHIATLQRQGNKLERTENVPPTDHRGDVSELEYHSRPFDVIMKEHIEENNWVCAELFKKPGDKTIIGPDVSLPVSLTVPLKVPSGWPFSSDPMKCTTELLEVSIAKLFAAIVSSPYFKDHLACDSTRLNNLKDRVLDHKEIDMPWVHTDGNGKVEIVDGYHRLHVLKGFGFKTIWIATNQRSKAILMNLAI